MFVYMCICSNTFFKGRLYTLLSPPAYGIFFYNSFLDLSLISRFPLYVHFPATVRGNILSGGRTLPETISSSRLCPVTQ